MVHHKLLLVNVKITFTYNFTEIFLEKPCNSMGSLSKLQNSFDHNGKIYLGISSIVSRSDAPILD